MGQTKLKKNGENILILRSKGFTNISDIPSGTSFLLNISALE